LEINLDHIRLFLASLARRSITDPALRKAAVLILLYLKDESLHLLFTKRTSIVEHHKGQISFPGGSADEGDTTLVQTALRETFEEIGLDTSGVEILGMYHDQWTPTGFCISPVIGYLATLPTLSPNRHEVEEIIEIPVSFFLDPANERVEVRHRSGKPIEVYFYRYRGHEVWGATAAIVRSFLADVRSGGSKSPPSGTSGKKNSLEIT
jgi:8-oxo-dGTP pyrophosphatase MutT (NUDIX family)